MDILHGTLGICAMSDSTFETSLEISYENALALSICSSVLLAYHLIYVLLFYYKKESVRSSYNRYFMEQWVARQLRDRVHDKVCVQHTLRNTMLISIFLGEWVEL